MLCRESYLNFTNHVESAEKLNMTWKGQQKLNGFNRIQQQRAAVDFFFVRRRRRRRRSTTSTRKIWNSLLIFSNLNFMVILDLYRVLCMENSHCDWNSNKYCRCPHGVFIHLPPVSVCVCFRPLSLLFSLLEEYVQRGDFIPKKSYFVFAKSGLLLEQERNKKDSMKKKKQERRTGDSITVVCSLLLAPRTSHIAHLTTTPPLHHCAAVSSQPAQQLKIS